MSGLTLHATCIVLGEGGVLLMGPSGAGKTSAALELIRRAAARRRFARLVSDDRVLIEARHGRLLARAHPTIAGRVEIRGLGIVTAAHEPVCRLRAVIELGTGGDRLPEASALRREIESIVLPSFRAGLDAHGFSGMEKFLADAYMMTAA